MRSNSLRLAVALGIVYVVWGSTFFAIKVAVTGFPPFLMAGVRFSIAGLLMYPVLRWRGAPSPTARQWGASAVAGLLVLVLGNGLAAWAELSVSSNVCAIAYGSVPLWAAITSAALGRRPQRSEWAGIAVGMMGVAVLNLGGELRGNPLAAVAILLGAVSMAAGAVSMKHLSLPPGPMAAASQLLCAGPILLAASWIKGEGPATPTAPATAGLAFLIVLGSLVAYSAYTWVQLHTRPAVATSNASVNPVVALLLGVGFGGERLQPTALIGIALIVAALALIARARTTPAAQPLPTPGRSSRPGLRAATASTSGSSPS